MVAQQKIKDSSVEATDGSVKPGSPKSRLAMLKRSNKQKNAANNDPFRFQGNGVDFKGKLIGERDVPEARGDGMCADAMRAAKLAVKQAGSHKQRIILNISIDGLKIKDEKSGAILYNFPVSKISFIARDTTDARAFGFIFGNADGKYKFYGIKTAQTADNAVLSIRDMFQVVFEMKKKQIQEMKQKKEEEAAENLKKENNYRIEDGVPCADLLDLESELQVIEQGCNQLQHIPSMPEDSVDPFGDSFATPVRQPVNNVPLNGDAFWGTPNVFNPPVQTYQPAPVLPQQQQFNAFPGTNPFANTVASTLNAPDPFDTQSAQRVISAINTTQSYGLPQPPQRQPPVVDVSSHMFSSRASSTHESNGQTSPEIDWGISTSSASSFKENSAPSFEDKGFDDLAKRSFDNGRVTTLEEAFSKLVDMEKLVPTQNPPPETKKNPFEHIINPPKMSLNSLSGPPPAFPPVQGQQIVNPSGGRDPFNDDFFN
ncbi:unnamed protein product [Bursaphelenchus okinawaensis]|uniref:PID domain-containing protein n=1 Tax=Bursaphelenchus okinawaensis TaxID=465554 RepID=A0A811K6J7_9BILA|nr:unnamed protein product [Bursaphelenchus okinawaensis]CAG9092586.1 unnamed protein product [Bursaphelenchus okinawaensis]